ncbi:hypothetical protein I4U23_011014 [Adineta vaga]|nr:hypothetical protein I4U23_011014 [Adineta vaga]
MRDCLLVFIPCVIMGSIFADSYVKDRKTLTVYTITKCLVFNYTFLEHKYNRYHHRSCNP